MPDTRQLQVPPVITEEKLTRLVSYFLANVLISSLGALNKLDLVQLSHGRAREGNERSHVQKPENKAHKSM